MPPADRPDVELPDDDLVQASVATALHGQRLICEGWFATHADAGRPGPHLHLRTSDGHDPVLRTVQLPGLVDALSAASEQIDALWAEEGEDFLANPESLGPDPDDPEVMRADRERRLSLVQRVADRLPDVVRVLRESDSTDDAIDRVARLLDADAADVMVGLASFDLFALTRPATERRRRVLEGGGD